MKPNIGQQIYKWDLMDRKKSTPQWGIEPLSLAFQANCCDMTLSAE